MKQRVNNTMESRLVTVSRAAQTIMVYALLLSISVLFWLGIVRLFNGNG
ncbi:MAG: hypothetical protein O3A51_06775 [Verrucomicrobia bacterium]|nr:hypothetical protein [Verrucomicrobiota bacterium]